MDCKTATSKQEGYPVLGLIVFDSVCGVSFVRLAAFVQGKDSSDITWVYCGNLIWWWVPLRNLALPVTFNLFLLV